MSSMSCDNLLNRDVIYASHKRMPLGLPWLARLCYVGRFHLLKSLLLACLKNEVHQITNIFTFYDGPNKVCNLLKVDKGVSCGSCTSLFSLSFPNYTLESWLSCHFPCSFVEYNFSCNIYCCYLCTCTKKILVVFATLKKKTRKLTVFRTVCKHVTMSRNVHWVWIFVPCLAN